MRLLPSFGILAVAAVAGCSNPLSPAGLHISTLVGLSGPPTVLAPDVVKVGERFTASFTTVAGGCDAPDRIAEAQTASERTVTVTPYNLNETKPGTMCPMYITFTTRSTDVAFAVPGVDTLRVVGYLEQSGSLQLGAIQKTILVNP